VIFLGKNKQEFYIKYYKNIQVINYGTLQN